MHLSKKFNKNVSLCISKSNLQTYDIFGYVRKWLTIRAQNFIEAKDKTVNKHIQFSVVNNN